MRIESSNLNLQGSSQIASMKSVEENLNVWTNQRQTETNSLSTTSSTKGQGIVIDIQDFSSQAIKISSSMTSSVSKTSQTTEEETAVSKEELKIRLIETFLSRLTGKRIRLNVPRLKLSQEGYDSSGNALASMNLVSASGGQQNSAGFGLIYNRNEIQTERSRVSFDASGVVKTSDGRKINLNLNFNVDQEIVKQSSFQLRIGEALKDPLVINFDQSLAKFTEKTMSFDIDYDGDKDSVQMLSASSGYLALDKNQNGIVDDGRELFGPQTDAGYEELAQFDEDGNGWIDESDSVFSQLKIWYHDEYANSQLVALTDKNVGAIYLGSVDTQMNLYSQNGMAGELRKSGLVLLENGESRVMQELDLKI